MDKVHDIRNAKVSGSILSLQIDGKDYVFDLAVVSKRLASSNERQRVNFEISPGGYGLHWPEIDEDLSIDGLLGIKHRPPAFACAH
jgi:hypothetical protein